MLGQVGRDLVRHGQSLHVLKVAARSGAVQLRAAADWHWQAGSTDPDTWMVRATCYGPSASETWLLDSAGVVFVRWGSAAGTTYRGRGPLAWASVAARLHAEADMALADESAGPMAHMIPTPSAGGRTVENDPMAELRADINKSRGKAVMVETMAAGFGEGLAGAPRRDWMASRLGPDMPAALVDLAQQAFERALAATGTPPAMFTAAADGTAQREAIRRWHLGTVIPLARVLEAELSRKLETRVRLEFDGYPKDMVSRAQVFAKLAAAEGMTPQQALEIAGLIEPDE